MDPAELARACAHLQAGLDSLTADERALRGLSVLGGSLDLCLFLRGQLTADANGLRIATGPPDRARILPEAIRHTRDEWIEGETPRRASTELDGARLDSIAAFAHERRAALAFVLPGGARRRLIAECFGPQGNWFLLDEDDVILAAARRPKGARETLVPGTRYAAPELDVTTDAVLPAPTRDPAWLAQRAAWYESHDETQRFAAERRQLTRALRRERKGLDARLRGLLERQQNEARASRLRREAELLLMQPEPGRRGLARLVVQDWYEEGRELEVELDPKLDLKTNAQRRFERARRLEEGTAHSAREREELDRRRSRLEELEAREAALVGPSDATTLRALLEELGRFAKRAGTPSRRQHERALRRAWRSYTSRDGMLLWVGRSQRDNDELLRKARGHDLWLHVGEGLGGSHVLVRLPRGKTASLECLLDAGELALHFSKGRGRPHCEVLYTPAKWVRKIKGSPPGLVEVQRSKTLQLEHDGARLARVLATQEER